MKNYSVFATLPVTDFARARTFYKDKLGLTPHNKENLEKTARCIKQAARKGDWKAVKLGPNTPVELYNLRTDPGEKENIADKHPDIVAKMKEYLDAAHTDSDD